MGDGKGYEELVQQVIADGATEDRARQAVNTLGYTRVSPEQLVGYEAVYEDKHGRICIRRKGSSENLCTILDWVGELNHYKNSTLCLISLVYDSGYILEDLGIGE